MHISSVDLDLLHKQLEYVDMSLAVSISFGYVAYIFWLVPYQNMTLIHMKWQDLHIDV
jgi:hypothetical protein